MAVKFIAQTDTLEQFRLEFNDLSANQFGDIANLSGAISATNLVDAMNETISIATSTAGFTIADDTSTTQIVGGGDTLTVLGTSNQIQSVLNVPAVEPSNSTELLKRGTASKVNALPAAEETNL